MPIYFAWFTTALLSVGADARDQNLPQSGRLLYCVIIPVRDTYLQARVLRSPNVLFASSPSTSIPTPVITVSRLTGSHPTEHLGDLAVELSNVRQLYDYNRWADRRILAVTASLASDDFIRPMGNSFSSVRDTLAHILSGEWIWLERWQGRSPKALLDAATFPTQQSLESRWKTVEHDQTQFIEALTPQRLSEELAYINQKGQPYSYPLWQQLVHVVNHSSYHRGQITTLLRQLGAPAVSTDFLLYYDEKPERS